MQALDTGAFVVREEFDLREVGLFLLGRFGDSPVEITLGDEIRQADRGDEVHGTFVVIIDGAIEAVLPPKAFEWRYDKFEETVDVVRAFVAHFDRVGDAVEQADAGFVFAILGIGVATAADGEVVHLGKRDDTGRALGQVKFFVFFLVIKSHMILYF